MSSMFNALAAVAVCGVLGSSVASAALYNGNGGTGFGGTVGAGALTVLDNGANVDFSFTAGASFTDNVLAIYIDSVPGGEGSTLNYTDTDDGGRRALSGTGGGTDRTVATFPALFGADFGVTVEPQFNFSGTYNLVPNASFGASINNSLAGAGTGPFTFSVAKTTLGLPTTGAYSFDFVGTLISGTAFRSNETIGTSITVPGNAPADPTNAGFTGTQTFSLANTFAVPEPASLSALALTGLVLRRRNRA